MNNHNTTPINKYFIFLIIILIVVLFFLFGPLINKKYSKEILTNIVVITTVNKQFTILLVPGHDTTTGGANFRNIYERNLTVDMANSIFTILNKDTKYKVIIARDKQDWNPIFANYFLNNYQSIVDFKNKSQTSNKLLISSGQKKIVIDRAKHSIVDKKTAIELYGINKWANENNVDLIIHLHFNSSGRKNINLPGQYLGFGIFIPEKQRINAFVSRIIAENIYKELQKKFTPEIQGYGYSSLFEDQSLIALGASDTLTKPSILIEYAYIYEKMLRDNINQKLTIEKMAEQTVLGIQDYMNSTNLKTKK